MEFKPTFEYYGTVFRLILQQNDIVLYERTHSDNIKTYEIHKLRNINGVSSIADTEEFGYYGFEYATMAKAMTKYRRIKGIKIP